MAYYSPLPDTLLVGGVDLQMIPGLIVESLDGLHAPGTRRGDNDTIPGRRGQLGTGKPLDAYSFSVPVTLLPTGTGGSLAARRAQTINALRAASAALMGRDGLVRLTRRLAAGTGYREATCAGEFVDGLAVEWLNPETGRTELGFVNLDGCWYSTTETTATPGTVDVAGDVPTRRIVLDLPGPGTLANYTTLTSVTVTTAAVLDVENYDASAGLATMTTSGPDLAWFALAPGPNTITWSGPGTPEIIYRAAYL